MEIAQCVTCCLLLQCECDQAYCHVMHDAVLLVRGIRWDRAAALAQLLENICNHTVEEARYACCFRAIGLLKALNQMRVCRILAVEMGGRHFKIGLIGDGSTSDTINNINKWSRPHFFEYSLLQREHRLR